MSDASGVAVFKTLSDLFNDPFGIRLLQSSLRLRLKISMQRATSDIIHDQNNIFIGIDDFK